MVEVAVTVKDGARSSCSSISASQFKKIDLFGISVPQLNVRGKSSVPTITGGLVSLVVIVVTFMFGLLKLEHMMRKKSPNISKFDDSSEFDFGA